MTESGFLELCNEFKKNKSEINDIKIEHLKTFYKMEEELENHKARTINEIINVKEENGEILISGRELHEFLEIGTPYAKWMPRMIEYGFEVNHDYAVTDKNVFNSNGGK